MDHRTTTTNSSSDGASSQKSDVPAPMKSARITDEDDLIVIPAAPSATTEMKVQNRISDDSQSKNSLSKDISKENANNPSNRTHILSPCVSPCSSSPLAYPCSSSPSSSPSATSTKGKPTPHAAHLPELPPPTITSTPSLSLRRSSLSYSSTAADIASLLPPPPLSPSLSPSSRLLPARRSVTQRHEESNSNARYTATPALHDVKESPQRWYTATTSLTLLAFACCGILFAVTDTAFTTLPGNVHIPIVSELPKLMPPGVSNFLRKPLFPADCLIPSVISDRVPAEIFLLLLLLLAPFSHLLGRMKHREYRFFQPFSGGRVYVFLQALAWSLYGAGCLFGLYAVWSGVRGAAKVLLRGAGVGGLLAQVLVLISIHYFAKSSQVEAHDGHGDGHGDADEHDDGSHLQSRLDKPRESQKASDLSDEDIDSDTEKEEKEEEVKSPEENGSDRSEALPFPSFSLSPSSPATPVTPATGAVTDAATASATITSEAMEPDNYHDITEGDYGIVGALFPVSPTMEEVAAAEAKAKSIAAMSPTISEMSPSSISSSTVGKHRHALRNVRIPNRLSLFFLRLRWSSIGLFGTFLTVVSLGLAIVVESQALALAPSSRLALGLFALAAVVIAVPTTHAIAGVRLHNRGKRRRDRRYRCWQPCLGGRRFVLLQAFGWALWTIALLAGVAIALCSVLAELYDCTIFGHDVSVLIRDSLFADSAADAAPHWLAFVPRSLRLLLRHLDEDANHEVVQSSSPVGLVTLSGVVAVLAQLLVLASLSSFDKTHTRELIKSPSGKTKPHAPHIPGPILSPVSPSLATAPPTTPKSTLASLTLAISLWSPLTSLLHLYDFFWVAFIYNTPLLGAAVTFFPFYLWHTWGLTSPPGLFVLCAQIAYYMPFFLSSAHTTGALSSSLWRNPSFPLWQALIRYFRGDVRVPTIAQIADSHAACIGAIRAMAVGADINTYDGIPVLPASEALPASTPDDGSAFAVTKSPPPFSENPSQPKNSEIPLSASLPPLPVDFTNLNPKLASYPTPPASLLSLLQSRPTVMPARHAPALFSMHPHGIYPMTAFWATKHPDFVRTFGWAASEGYQVVVDPVERDTAALYGAGVDVVTAEPLMGHKETDTPETSTSAAVAVATAPTVAGVAAVASAPVGFKLRLPSDGKQDKASAPPTPDDGDDTPVDSNSNPNNNSNASTALTLPRLAPTPSATHPLLVSSVSLARLHLRHPLLPPLLLAHHRKHPLPVLPRRPGELVDILGASALPKCAVLREVFLWSGGRDVSRHSIYNCLSQRRSCLLIAGGQKEMSYARPEDRNLTLYTRHAGFVRLALQCGAPLIPVLSFGENQMLSTVEFPSFQQFLYRYTRIFLPLFPHGRWYSSIPYKIKIGVRIGTPLYLPLIEDPDEATVAFFHSLYYAKVRDIFFKHRDEEGYADAKLIFI